MNQNEIELAFIGSLINGREEMEIALEQGIESEYFLIIMLEEFLKYLKSYIQQRKI